MCAKETPYHRLPRTTDNEIEEIYQHAYLGRKIHITWWERNPLFPNDDRVFVAKDLTVCHRKTAPPFGLGFAELLDVLVQKDGKWKIRGLRPHRIQLLD